MDDGPSGPAVADILLIEDNPGDVRLVEETFRDGTFSNTLHTVSDGREALDFVDRNGEYADAVRPDLILLDLGIPRVDGEDVLHEIRHHPEVSDVPVIVLAGVNAEYVESQDLDHDADEDAVIEKPIDIDELTSVIGELDGLLLSIVRTEPE